MKRIAYWFMDLKYKDVLLEFCRQEDFMPVELAIESKAPEQDDYLFYVTDCEQCIDRAFQSPTPRALITSASRISYKYYLLNKDLNIKSFRLFTDRIYHGDALWNTVKGIHTKISFKECYIDNDLSNVERFVCLMTDEVLNYCGFSELEKIRVGFSEMLTNAIEHGNLNITSFEKHQATEAGVYQELLSSRLSDPLYASRKVYCRVGVFTDRVDIVICDEGTGFDVNNLPSASDSQQLLKLHGRGVLIAKAYYDDIKYNDKGNEVTMVKRFVDTP